MLITAVLGLFFNLAMMKVLHSDLSGGFGHSCGGHGGDDGGEGGHSHGGHSHGGGHSHSHGGDD